MYRTIAILHLVFPLLLGLSFQLNAMEITGGMNAQISREEIHTGYYAKVSEGVGLRAEYYSGESDLYYYNSGQTIYLNRTVRNLLVSFDLLNPDHGFTMSLAGGPYFVKFHDPRTEDARQINTFGLKGECGYAVSLLEHLKLSFNLGVDIVNTIKDEEVNDINSKDIEANEELGGFYYGAEVSLAF